MEKKIFYDVYEVMAMLTISKSHAYKIIRELNRDLREQGYMTITGKVSCKYFVLICFLMKDFGSFSP